MKKQKGRTALHRWHMNSIYREPERLRTWTIGLVGGAIGMLVVGALWYVRTQTRAQQQTPKRLGLSRHGQSPSRSHIQMSSHPARQV